MKFVILDEVDYMTKNAQQALKYLLQNYSSSVRFCLICNYISKIDEGLQNEFMRLRFNQLPKPEIIRFLRNISKTENLIISEKSLELIQKLYKSDIRSMINFIQSKQDVFKIENIKKGKVPLNEFEFIIDDNIWETITTMIASKQSIVNIETFIHNISINYNIDKKNIIKDYINYIIRNKPDVISSDFLNFAENIMHSQDCNNKTHLYYSLSKLSLFI
jgi:DNA polymerase III delta prime subunit